MTSAAEVDQMASAWLARREAQWDDADAASLADWLEADPIHKVAYWRIEYAWRQADRLAALRTEEGPARRRGRWSAPAAAAALVLMAICLGWLWTAGGLVTGHSYVTAVGGSKTLFLADGSRIEMDTATALRVSLAGAARNVWLDRGQAYFEVAHDGRPFVVHAGQRSITVLGTRFAVRRDGDQVKVSVVEGKVRVSDGASQEGRKSQILTRGEIELARGPSSLVEEQGIEHVADDLTWRRGQLVFDRTTLADAAEEFNRYNARKIIIGDTQTAALRIGGRFESNNVDAFVRLLQEAYGLKIVQSDSRIEITG